MLYGSKNPGSHIDKNLGNEIPSGPRVCLEAKSEVSKFCQIIEALDQNINVMVVAVEENDIKSFLFSSEEKHIVDIFVAPTVGIYKIKELQELMMTLIPNLEPSRKNNFWESSDGSCIYFGNLQFEETIGIEHIRREIILFNDDIPWTKEEAGIVDKTRELKRRIQVKLFPNILIASYAASGPYNEHSIAKTRLFKYDVL